MIDYLYGYLILSLVIGSYHFYQIVPMLNSNSYVWWFQIVAWMTMCVAWPIRFARDVTSWWKYRKGTPLPQMKDLTTPKSGKKKEW